MWYLERTINKAESRPGFAISHAEQIQSTLNSYLGFLKWCNAYRLRERVCNMVSGSILGTVLKPSKDNSKVTICKQYTKKTYYRNEYKSLKQQLKIA